MFMLICDCVEDRFDLSRDIANHLQEVAVEITPANSCTTPDTLFREIADSMSQMGKTDRQHSEHRK